MKSKNEILENSYTVNSNRGEIVFSNKTPQKLANLIVQIIESGQRIVFDYGDIATGKSWNETFDISGYIGLSKGHYNLKWPILLNNTRSIGGGTILTDCVLSVKESKGKKTLYNHETAI